jgi:hypothetical protein
MIKERFNPVVQGILADIKEIHFHPSWLAYSPVSNAGGRSLLQ